MKRDMDVIRQILLAARDADEPLGEVGGIDKQTFCNHVVLLEEAGLVKAIVREQHGQALHAMILRLTWEGQDFADAVKDDSLWRKARDQVIKPAGSWTFGILVEYLRAEIRSRLPGLPL